MRLLPFSQVKSAKAKGASASLVEGEEEEPVAEVAAKEWLASSTALTFVVDAGSGCVALDDIPARASSSARGAQADQSSRAIGVRGQASLRAMPDHGKWRETELTAR